MNAAADAPVLSVEGLCKTYVSFRKQPGLRAGIRALWQRQTVAIAAVKPLHFTIQRGEFVGLLGPNGAGKTTTLKMLAGLIRPTSGRALAFGEYDTARRPVAYLRRIGMVMGQRNQLNPDLPAMDSLRLAQAIYGLDEERWRRRLATCRELFELGDLLLQPVRKLSLGERMKMELILAMLHEPELLFLDEPTIGLDFHAARQIRSFLQTANRELAITVILTSHYPKDIEDLCRRVVVINHGSLVYDGPLATMDARLSGQKMVTLVFKNEAAVLPAMAATQQLKNAGLPLNLVTPDRYGEEGSQTQWSFETAPAATATVLAALLATLPADSIADVRVTDRPLEDIFRDLYQQSAL